MRSYEAARSLFSFLGFCSWAVIFLGAVLAFSGGTIIGTGMGRNASGLSALMGAAPGFILAMLGFYGLALVQMGRAGVDSAEYAQQSLDVSRQQLEISKQVVEQGATLAVSYAALIQNRPVDERPVDTASVEATDDQFSYGTRETEEPLAARKKPAPESEQISAPEDEEPPEEVAAITEIVLESLPETAAPEPKAEDLVLAANPPEPELKPVLPSLEIDTPSPENEPEAETDPVLETPKTIVEKTIMEENGVFTYGNLTFSSRDAAERYISQFGVNPNAKLADA